MLFRNALERLKQLSESKIGATPSGDFLRFTQIDQKEGTINDVVLSTLESARLTLSPEFGAAEFKFYQPSATEQFIVLHGRSAESVSRFDFRAIEQRVSELVNELLVGWQPYDLSLGDIPFGVQDKVIEIRIADLAPIKDVALIKAFTFGGAVGEGGRASIVGDFILDLLRYTKASESLLPVKCSDAGSVVIMRPETLEYIRTLAGTSYSEPGSRKPMSDPLTGLLTRQALLAVLDDASTKSSSGDGEHSILWIDIDHFSRCNYTFGHAQGDRVLIELASLMTRELPAPNHLGRIGGDEFLAVLPSTGLSAAVAAAERLRTTIERAAERQALSCPITVTIAVATTPMNTSWSSAEVIMLAESRLIVGKKRLSPGRNRVWAGDLPVDWYRHWDANWPSSGPIASGQNAV